MGSNGNGDGFKMLRVGPIHQIDEAQVEKWRHTYPTFGPVFDHFKTRERGNIVSYETVETLCGFTREMTEYQRVMQCVKGAMRFITGITVRSRPRVGYVLTTVREELTTHVDRTLAGAQKKIKNQALNVALVRQDKLSLHERRTQLFAREQCDQSAGAIQTRREVLERGLVAPETLPRLVGEQV